MGNVTDFVIADTGYDHPAHVVHLYDGSHVVHLCDGGHVLYVDGLLIPEHTA